MLNKLNCFKVSRPKGYLSPTPPPNRPLSPSGTSPNLGGEFFVPSLRGVLPFLERLLALWTLYPIYYTTCCTSIVDYTNALQRYNKICVLANFE